MKQKRVTKKQLLGPLLFALAIVVLDQLSKLLVVRFIPYGERVQVLPGVVCLTYVRNEGAAFSMLPGGRWLFLGLVAVFFVVLALLLYKGMLKNKAELWALAAVCGGALGNAIDRAVSGNVVDMIEPQFMQFAVFNVADSFITCGAIALAVYLLFFSGRAERRAKEARDAAEK